MGRPHCGENLLVANNNIGGQILAGDKTILDVFGEKSKDADDIKAANGSFSSVLSGTGGKNIFGQEVAPLSQVELLEMIMPMAGSIRGGKVAKSTMQQLMDIAKRSGIKDHPSKWEWSKKMIGDFVHGNKISAARMKNQQVLDKYGITDPDKAEFLDTISAYLTRSRN